MRSPKAPLRLRSCKKTESHRVQQLREGTVIHRRRAAVVGTTIKVGTIAGVSVAALGAKVSRLPWLRPKLLKATGSRLRSRNTSQKERK